MVKINKIYTRTGDDGNTGLVDGSRISKSSLRIQCFGDLDELNSYLGLIRTDVEELKLWDLLDKLKIIQNEIFDIGGYLATPEAFKKYPVFNVKQEHISKLEQWIDQANESLPELKSFVLPGGTPLNSHIHIARTICRRAERTLVELSRTEPILPLTIIYLNRLSDLLFSWAREESKRAGNIEYLWEPATKRGR